MKFTDEEIERCRQANIIHELQTENDDLKNRVEEAESVKRPVRPSPPTKPEKPKVRVIGRYQYWWLPWLIVISWGSAFISFMLDKVTWK